MTTGLPIKRSFSSDESLLSELNKLAHDPGESIAIVAGHFMLMYDDRQKKLVPMIHQDSTNPNVIRLSKLMAGDFPVRTFGLGFRLQQTYVTRGATAKIVLIVNDHVFTTPGWAQQNLPDLSSAAKLRHDFYREKYPLPKSYFQQLTAAGAGTDVIMDDNHPGRTPQNIVPKISRLFSEQALRNHFDKVTRLQIRDLPGFKEERGSASKAQLLFSQDGHFACLTDDHGCGCSGELLEFIRRLAVKGIQKIVFFVPNECRAAASLGFSAFMHLTPTMTKGIAEIHSISGLGGVADAGGGIQRITVETHFRNDVA